MRAVVQRVGQVIAVLVRAQAPDAGAVGLHHVEVAARFVLVVFVALERGAAPLGDEDNVAAGGVGRVEVAPFARGELAQVLPVNADLEDMGRLDRPAEVVTAGAVEPAFGRLVGRRARIAEHDAAAVPPQVHAMHMAGTQGAVQQIAKVQGANLPARRGRRTASVRLRAERMHRSPPGREHQGMWLRQTSG